MYGSGWGQSNEFWDQCLFRKTHSNYEWMPDGLPAGPITVNHSAATKNVLTDSFMGNELGNSMLAQQHSS